MEKLTDRLKLYMRRKSLNSLGFSEFLGYKNSEKISRLFRKENAMPSAEILSDISNKCENLNIDWLLTGRGSMLREVGKSGEGRTTPSYPEEGNISVVNEDVVEYGSNTSQVEHVGRLQRRVAELEDDKRRLQREVDSLHEMLAGYKKNGLAGSDTVQKKSVG